MEKPAPCASPPLPHPPRRWALFLDVDGTLTPLAPRPDDVVLGAAVIGRLSSLRTAFEEALAVISGRAIPDLDHLLAPLRLPVAGQHGAERRDAGGGVHHADPDAVEALSEARETLARFAADNPGIELQDKRLTLSLHYRRAPHCAQAARRLLRRLEPTLGRRFVVEEGKQVLEVRSRGCNKGSAIRAFLQEAPFGGADPCSPATTSPTRTDSARSTRRAASPLRSAPAPPMRATGWRGLKTCWHGSTPACSGSMDSAAPQTHRTCYAAVALGAGPRKRIGFACAPTRAPVGAARHNGRLNGRHAPLAGAGHERSLCRPRCRN